MAGFPQARDEQLCTINMRISRANKTRLMWFNVAKVSAGAFFEIYEVALTGLLGPLLTQAGIFRMEHGFLGLPDLATFAFATFGGLCVGVLASSVIADRCGRRPVFLTAPLVYGAATLVMATQSTASALCLWRFVAAVGVGAEAVAVDAYLAELTPNDMRGRGFAVSKAIQYLAVPFATALASFGSRGGVPGFAGWQLPLVVPVLGAVFVWWLRRDLPESPRWLDVHDLRASTGLAADTCEGTVVQANVTCIACPATLTSYADLFRPPLRRRIALMIVAGGASSIAYYGFGTWLPTIIQATGVAATKSLLYSAIVGCAFPLTPLCLALVADRVERKWQIVTGAATATVAGLCFSVQATAFGWIVFGLLVVAGNNVMACASHTYRSELFPTVLRGRAIGFVYACDRLVAAFASYLIGWILVRLGAQSVLFFIAAAALLDMGVIGILGPRTLGRSTEAIPG